MKRNLSASLYILLAGLVLLLSACGLQASAAPKAEAASSSPSTSTSVCDLPACANLVVTQDGQPQGSQAAASFALPADVTSSPWKIDTGSPSPNGDWVAYTSISSESGGPVFLQNVKTGEYINLIDAVNAHLPAAQSPFALDYGWDVIGWFPNSASLMIGPLDLSLAVIVELNTYASQSIPFPGGGRGGRQFVNLAPDGKRFIFITDDTAGDQVMNSMEIETGQISELLRLPYEEGILTNPRYSPDQSSVAYLEQSGQIDPGLTYSIRLLSTQTGQSETLAQDNLAVSVPLWSPDGRSIAFIRREGALPAPPSKDTLPQDEHTNLWVISVADQKQTQASFADGFVRSPAWEGDNQTLAYVMGDGQVELVNLAQPGKSWQAAGPSAVPELTSVFFLP